MRLYADVEALAGSLLPTTIAKPTNLNIPRWKTRTPKEFIEHLLNNGNADNRYLIYGYITDSQDLYMLDTMVFAVRRLVCALDERWLTVREREGPDFTNRELLSRQPEHYGRLFMPLDDLVTAELEKPKRVAALNLNMAFAPANYQHKPLRSSSQSRNPVIVRRILEPLESNDAQQAAEGIAIAHWLLENVKLPRGSTGEQGVDDQIKAAVAAAKRRHNIP